MKIQIKNQYIYLKTIQKVKFIILHCCQISSKSESLSISNMKVLLQKELYGNERITWKLQTYLNPSNTSKLVETNQKIIMNALMLKII